MYASSMHASEQETSRTSEPSPFKLRNLIRCIRHRPGDDKQQSPLERTSTNNSVGISEPKMLYDEDSAAWSRPSSRNSEPTRRRDHGMTHIPEQGCAEMLEDENFAWGSPSTRFRRQRSTSR
ncbi:hypothetical protein C8Q74DRAFT_1291250 [Fomes fomentarius]|nr:hypothetical protein C8Q74DRAFT_1291250 [Fomes fomentarius]